MTSVGVIASSVVLPSAVDVLFEPFNDFTTNSWATTGSCSIVAARTGNGARLIGTPGSNFARYTIPAPNQSATLTIGFAYRVSNATGTRSIARLESDAAATSAIYVDVLTTGAVEVRTGTASGSILATSAASVIPINTYVYVELQANIHDTTGFVTLRVGGTQVAAATNVDTKVGVAGATFDAVCLLAPNSGINNTFDDLYLTMGAGATFKGNITIP